MFRPNEIGLTPLHEAASGGCPKVFLYVINAGGDLRLHDYEGFGVASKIGNITSKKKQLKMHAILEERTEMGKMFTAEGKFGDIKSRLRYDLLLLVHILPHSPCSLLSLWHSLVKDPN